MKGCLIVSLLIIGLAASFQPAQAATPSPTPSKAPVPTPTPVRNAFFYSVKFVCGLETPAPSLKPPQELPVKPGNYATAINVHNFRSLNLCIAKKAVVAFPEAQGPTRLISPFRPFALIPDGAFDIDCADILSLFPAGSALPPFIEGFVEIQSPVQLNVQAVYTSQTCHTSSTAAGCTSLGELSIDVVSEPSYFFPRTSTVCP
jgi:hypothetical protein